MAVHGGSKGQDHIASDEVADPGMCDLVTFISVVDEHFCIALCWVILVGLCWQLICYVAPVL